MYMIDACTDTVSVKSFEYFSSRKIKVDLCSDLAHVTNYF